MLLWLGLKFDEKLTSYNTLHSILNKGYITYLYNTLHNNGDACIPALKLLILLSFRTVCFSGTHNY